MMYNASVNATFKYNIALAKNVLSIDGATVAIDLIAVDNNVFHILYNNKSFLADIIEVNKADKYCLVKINGNIYRVEIKDKYDELLHQLGMDNIDKNKVNDIKAPMPGLVLKILVNEGDILKKGDSLFILEAMKMENIIKSPGDATVKSIKAQSGDKVEKNQPIIIFE